MRSRTLLLIAFVAMLGAAVAMPPALATPSKVKLEVNQNCVDPNWPCWTAETSALKPQPALKVMITEGGEVEFADHDTSRTASVVWTGGPATPSCPGVPTTTTASTGWEGTCTFTMPGTYHFESSTLFKEAGLYGTNDYQKYEVVVTGPPTPAATTEQATQVTETEATLNGSVNPEGQATSYYFEYGSTESYGTKTGELSGGSGSTGQKFHFTWAGLSPNTTYYFQLVAVYGAGKTKVEGGKMTFKTAAPPGAPTASTQPATGVTETEATLTGAVNPDGEATKYFFKWGTTIAYGQTTGSQPAGEDHASHVVSAVLTGLAPGATYHFQIVAENKLGTVPGADETFTTKSAPAKEPTKTTTTTTPTTTTPTIPPPIEPLLSPLFVGGPSLRSSQHGSSVRGSLDVASSGAGGRLEVDLIANSASLARRGHSKQLTVGRLVRTSLYAGKVSFSVSLNAKAKRALSRHHKLALSVQIVLTPLHGAPVSTTRGVVLHA
jgi:hypothetical protein